uniref:Uncharacterized protein n=1 Tax=Podoviridae sp. ctG4L18 TaxID=2825234 RepID=A0A8S5UPP1_9CAUD|nr:MAG TPA: hypothetical protein [Podoviridae sp. ctG4L18]
MPASSICSIQLPNLGHHQPTQNRLQVVYLH